jgi:uncharacterized protein (TIGR02300 family)
MHGEHVVAKPNLGFKRVCGNCGTKFYDFGRTPIVCPKCETVYVVSTSTRAAARQEPVAAAVVEEPDVPVAGAEIISLEEADAEATGKKKPAAGGADGDADTDDDVEVVADDDADDTFLEEEEEEAGDVSDIIGEKLEEDRET